MPGLTYHYPAQARLLAGLGLAFVDRGNGSSQDYGVRKARTAKACAHLRPGGYRLDVERPPSYPAVPCGHPTIEPGEAYVELMVGWMDAVPVSMPCAVAAGWYAPTS